MLHQSDREGVWKDGLMAELSVLRPSLLLIEAATAGHRNRRGGRSKTRVCCSPIV